jgi:ribosome biogenesis protein MAK21
LQGLQSGKEPQKAATLKKAEQGTKASKRKQEKKSQAKAPELSTSETPKSDGKNNGKKKARVAEPEPEPMPAPLPSLTSSVKSAGKLVLLPDAHWYTSLPPLQPPSKPLGAPSASQISSLTERAASLLVADAAAYQASSAFTGNSASDSRFLNTILSKGTLSDRLSALTLLVQASPVHNTKALETLKGMAERGRGKGGREEGLKAMRCVVDWWVGGGAPGRKLKWVNIGAVSHDNRD